MKRMKNILIIFLTVFLTLSYSQNNMVSGQNTMEIVIYHDLDFEKDVPRPPGQNLPLNYTVNYPSDNLIKTIQNLFIDHVKKNGEVINKTGKKNNSPGNGMKTTFQDISNSFNNKESLVKSQANFYSEVEFDNKVRFDKASNTFLMNQKTIIKYYEASQKYYLSDSECAKESEKSEGKNIFCAANFFEKWKMDAETGTFSKSVINWGADYCCEEQRYPLFNFEMGPFKAKTKVVLVDNMIYDVLINYNSTTAEKPDEEYTKNTCDNTDYYNYIEPRERGSFISLLLKSIYDKKCTAYACNENGIDSTKVLFSDEVRSTLQSVYESYDGGTEYDDLSIGECISGFRFYETWYFDKKNFSLHKKVNGIVLLKLETVYDFDPDDIVGVRKTPLFFVGF